MARKNRTGRASKRRKRDKSASEGSNAVAPIRWDVIEGKDDGDWYQLGYKFIQDVGDVQVSVSRKRPRFKISHKR